MSLEQLLEERASKDEQIIITSATYGLGDEWWYLHNFVGQLHRQAGIQNYIVLVADDTTYLHCSRLGLPCYKPKGMDELTLLWERSPRFKGQSKESLAARLESAMKVQTMVEALLLGYTVLYADLNTVFFRNPFPALEHRDHAGQYGGKPVRSMCSRDGNAWFGFVFARPEDRVVGLFKVLNAAQHDSGSPWDSGLFSSVVGSKSMWRDMFECLSPTETGFVDNCYYAGIKAGGKGGEGAAQVALNTTMKVNKVAVYANCVKHHAKREWLKEVGGWSMPRCSTRPCLELEDLTKGEAKALGTKRLVESYKHKHWGREHQQACDKHIFASIDREECFLWGNCTCACDRLACNDAYMENIDLSRDWLDAGRNLAKEESKRRKKFAAEHHVAPKEFLKPHPPPHPDAPPMSVVEMPMMQEATYLGELMLAVGLVGLVALAIVQRDITWPWVKAGASAVARGVLALWVAAGRGALATGRGVVWLGEAANGLTKAPILPGDRPPSDAGGV